MKGQMKRYFNLKGWAMFLSGAFVLSSCAEDEVVEKYAPNTDGESISFSISKANPTWEPDSRAVVESGRQNFVLRSEESDDTLCVSARTEYGFQNVLSRGALVTDKSVVTSFEVFSNFYTQSQPNVSSFYFMKNEQVSDGVNPSKAYYWPPADCNLDFIALAPYKAGRTWKSEDTDGNPIAPQLTYTVDDDVTKHEDLMIAKTDKMNLGNSTNASVPLSFNHILASVQFAFGDMPEGTVKSISISGPLSKIGTYTVDGNWSNSNAESVTYTIAADAGVATTQDVNGKKIVNEKIITLPQSFEAEKLTLTVVFNDNSAGERTLTAKIPAGKWAQGTTTNYTISITEAYDLQFTTSQESIPVKDCHYEFQELSVQATKIPEGGSWKIVAYEATKNSSGEYVVTKVNNEPKVADWVKFRTKPTDTNDKYYQGYWIENNIERETSKSSPTPQLISNLPNTSLILEGNISTDIIAYLYENVETAPNSNETARYAIVKLLDGNGEEHAQRVISQYYPQWNNNTAYELIEEDNGPFPWGYCWDRIIKYSSKGSSLTGKVEKVIYYLIFKYGGSYKESYMQLSPGWVLDYLFSNPDVEVTIDYGRLSSLGTIGTSSSGLTNTTDLINHTGENVNTTELFTSDYLKKVSDTHDTDLDGELDDGNEEIDYSETAVYKTIMKNKFNRIITIAVGDDGSRNPGDPTVELTSNGVQWYLPARQEIANLKGTEGNNELSSNVGYWTSSVPNNNTHAYYYSADEAAVPATTELRTAEKKIRAARKK